ncbi:MAG: hypothetical protein ACP5I8_17645, partial [Phycisphaerae bacterium]
MVKAILAPAQSGRVGLQLWPYVNGRQWGAPAKLDRHGVARLMIPLPQPGTARIRVAASGPEGASFPVGQPMP